MESMGFAISYADNAVEINDDDLDELADDIEEMDSQMNSQFNRKMDDNNGYYDYS